MQTPNTPPPLALTMGDPAGIGGELTVLAWRALRSSGPVFAAIDDPQRLRALDPTLPIEVIADIGEAGAHFGAALPVLAQSLPRPAVPGQPDRANATATIGSIETAVGLAMAGKAGGLVTNPINKAALYAAGFAHPGHTEFLAALTGGAMPVMMLACPLLRTVPVTIHLSLKAAIAALSEALIVETALVTAHALRRDFGIATPRLVLAGLNPHAGEGGAMGREDLELIVPAITRLRALGIEARGPYPADTLFTEAARACYDVALGMYHDQALIPLKTLDMHNGVNVTLGLPIIRTSPDHGTAYDIAGKGIADPRSLIAALRLAGEMVAARALVGNSPPTQHPAS